MKGVVFGFQLKTHHTHRHAGTREALLPHTVHNLVDRIINRDFSLYDGDALRVCEVVEELLAAGLVANDGNDFASRIQSALTAETPMLPVAPTTRTASMI